jgi:hypothetical protein
VRDVDEHAECVTQPLREVWFYFDGGQATLLDLMRVCETVATSLDNAYAPLLRVLRDAAYEAERAYFTLLPENHRAAGERRLSRSLWKLRWRSPA